MLHPVIGTRIGARQNPFRSRFVENEYIPGGLAVGIAQFLRVMVDAKGPEIPEMLDSRVVQVSGRFLSSEAVVVLQYGRPEDKDLDPGIR